MKVVKPLRLGVLTRPFERENKHFLSIAIVTFFPFDQPDRLLPEVSLWKLAAEVLGEEGVLDECMPKLTAEVLVAGSAFPRNPPQPHCQVKLSMGPVARSFYVFGDRAWQLTGPTDPQPFAEMPLTWSRAFGGPGFAKNPVGKGIKGEGRQPLPNIEDPRAIVRSPGDKPEPCCPMPLDMSWPQRAEKAGTYDQKWLERQYPGYPLDFDWSFFQVAQEAQRFPGFLEGGEAFTIENMHESHGVQSSRLPVGRARAIAVRKGPQGDETVDLSTRIDTVWLFPNQRRGAVIHRAVMEVREDDAADVLHVVGAYELPGEPRPLAHYEKALADRLDAKDALAAALRDRDFLPELPPKGEHADDELSDMERLLTADNALIHNVRRGTERRLAEASDRVAELTDEDGIRGQPTPEMVTKLAPQGAAPTLDDLPEVMEKAARDAEEARAQAEEAARKSEAEARALCSEQGLDYDKLVAEAKDRELRKKRPYSARRQLDEMEAMATLEENAEGDAVTMGGDPPYPPAQPGPMRAALADPQLVEKLLAMEKQVNDAYRQTAHLMEQSRAEPDDYSRDELREGARAGRTFAGRDLTNADLSGLDLTGIDLEGAFLEGANLRGAVLDGANLRCAVMARADLTGTSLVAADLTDANLGGGTLDDANLEGAGLERTTLWGTTLRRTRLATARLSFTQLGEAQLEDVDLSNAKLSDLLLFRTKLTRVKLAGASLVTVVFVEAELADVDFTRATCPGVCFLAGRGERVTFDGADLGNARFVKGCDFTKATFVGARLKGANLRGTVLAGADFTRAVLDAADVSEADLGSAKLDHVRASEALFIRTKLKQASVREAVLVQAILQKARVEGADFGGANLFRADALGMRGDQHTSLRDAFVKRVRFTPAGRNG